MAPALSSNLCQAAIMRSKPISTASAPKEDQPALMVQILLEDSIWMRRETYLAQQYPVEIASRPRAPALFTGCRRMVAVGQKRYSIDFVLSGTVPMALSP